MSYTTVAGADLKRTSKVVVEPCTSANISQHWTVQERTGQILAADGRCLTVALSPPWFNHCPGAVVAPCDDDTSSSIGGRQVWHFDRGLRTISGVVNNASSETLPAGHTALSVVAPVPVGNGGDWQSVALFPFAPESQCSGASCRNASHHATAPQMWYFDQRQKGRLQAMPSFNLMMRPAASPLNAPTRLCLSVSMNEELQVWAAPLVNGSMAVLLINRLETPHDITAHWSALGIADATARKTVRDVSRRVDIGVMTGSLIATVPGHSAKLFKLAEPARCHSALAAACPERRSEGTANGVMTCDACIGKHQAALRDAACTSDEVHEWCRWQPRL